MEPGIRCALDKLLFLALIWISHLHRSQGEIPTRSYEDFISGSDPFLQLTESSFCPNSTGERAINFQRLLLNGDALYVGATNHILQINVDPFSLTHSIVNGPREDDPGCVGPPICPAVRSCENLNCANNKNRLLMVHRDQILACGTIYLGTCSVLTLGNISKPYLTSAEEEGLTCSKTSQITKNMNDDAVASLFISEADPVRDLFYIGSEESFAAFYLPDSGVPDRELTFTIIDKTSTYTSGGSRTFLASWTTSNHSFMLWTRNGDNERTKISRLCHNSLNDFSRKKIIEEDSLGYGRSSYIETNVFCDKFTNIVLAYTRYGKLYGLFEKEGKYILCSVIQAKINGHFHEARESCFNGNTDKAVFIPSKPCGKLSKISPSLVECGLPQADYNFLSALECKQDLVFKMVFTWPDQIAPPTTLAVDLVNGFTTGFFGTQDGEILKAKLAGDSGGFIESIILEKGSPVLKDVSFDESSQHLYALTATKVFKVRLSNCNQYTSCSSCLTSLDPYCGWCTLQSRCTQKSECPNSSKLTHWMKSDVVATECPQVANIVPSALSVMSPQKLSLVFTGNQLPTAEYHCEFVVAGRVLSTSQLQNFSTSPSCMSPPTPPVLPDGQDHATVTLNIRTAEQVIAYWTFEIYDCTKIPGIETNSMCSSCVASPWNCSWCSQSHTCSDKCIHPDTATPRQADCPSVIQVYNQTDSITVGKSHEFVLQTSNLPEDIDLMCAIEFCDSSVPAMVPGMRENDTIRCSVGEDELNCEDQDSFVRISLQNDGYVIDSINTSAVTVNLFNCTGREAECGLCMNSRGKHEECAWCVGVQTCVPQMDCDDGSDVTNISFCPVPMIDTVSPLDGPSDGGTELSLVGRNLGSSDEQILSVTIRGDGKDSGGVECRMIQEKYVPSRRIICETEKASATFPGGLVHIRFKYKEQEIESKQHFRFKVVTTESFEPKYAMNGTKVTIGGSNLNAGSGAQIVLEDGRGSFSSECNFRTEELLICRVPEVQSTGLYSVLTVLDGYRKKLEGNIQFVKSPTTVELIGRANLNSFKSGGQLVTFSTSSLLGVQRVFIEVGSGVKSEDCDLDVNTTTIVCAFPPMKNPVENSTRRKRAIANDNKGKQGTSRAAPQEVSADLVINDQVRIPLDGDKLTIVYIDDPIIEPVTKLPCQSADTSGTRTIDPSTSGINSSIVGELTGPDGSDSDTIAFQFRGSNLNLAASKEDYTVLIAKPGETESVNCKTDILDSTALICRAPLSEMKRYEGFKVEVTVIVGNFSQTLPAVEYCFGSELVTIIIATVVPIVIILVFIILTLLLCYRRRAKKQRKEREQIMFMLDTLENKTRETARKAYFELQLGYMTTLTDNLSDSITYLPPVSCFMRALFNDWKQDHPMLNTKAAEEMHSVRISGLDRFIQLLKNKDFLITLIKTLEEQKHFTVKEKGQFASLLTVCLFDDLVYFTRIMMDLLSDLIQRHVSKNPKLLLRRSESVVEKIVSHWLTINLYTQCIRKQAGKPLFLLTKAIHFLVNSAPSDVVANKAVNSLNEMTLLGTEITYEAITLRASVIEKGEKTNIVDVKVVNCDTITQVKEKIIEVIYRDRPYSECPKPDDLELELIAGQGHLVLSDIDNTSRQDDSYTQINTLKHYNVPDGAEVVLSPVKKVLEAQNGNGNPAGKPKKRLYHLINPRDKEVNGHIEEDDTTGGSKTKAIIGNLINQPFKEIYLTRMVKSKTTVQEYVDGVFNAILKPDPKSRAVKYFFQFLDREASKHKISDPEVVHIWKTNSLLLRYWVNVLKNPEFLFDVNKTMVVDSCLNVITQAFMDACTTTNHKLGQDSPSNKLLYAKEAGKYREMVSKFFDDIASEDLVTDQDLNQSLMEISKDFSANFNRRAAAEELYTHLEKYQTQVQGALEDDPALLNRLNEILSSLSFSPNSNGRTADLLV